MIGMDVEMHARISNIKELITHEWEIKVLELVEALHLPSYSSIVFDGELDSAMTVLVYWCFQTLLFPNEELCFHGPDRCL